MTSSSPVRPRHESGDFARARAEAVSAENVQRVRAARTIAGNSLDAHDRQDLLAMLDLPDPNDTTALLAALVGYVRAVAVAIGVPHEGTACEVTDTVTAYLGLVRRRADLPGRDLMLVWSEDRGWSVSVETDPSEAPVVLSRLGGHAVPRPEVVARFVIDVFAG